MSFNVLHVFCSLSFLLCLSSNTSVPSNSIQLLLLLFPLYCFLLLPVVVIIKINKYDIISNSNKVLR